MDLANTSGSAGPFSMFKGRAAGFTIAPPPWISPNARRRAICSGCLSDWTNNRQGRIFAEKRCERCLKNAVRGALRCLEGGCLSTFNLWVPCQSWSWARNKKSLRASRGVPKNKLCGAKWCFLVPGGCLSSPTNNHPELFLGARSDVFENCFALSRKESKGDSGKWFLDWCEFAVHIRNISMAPVFQGS